MQKDINKRLLKFKASTSIREGGKQTNCQEGPLLYVYIALEVYGDTIKLTRFEL